MTTTVAVIGGGVAGMTAAQELAERGFKVTVYEDRNIAGGKARSVAAIHSSIAGNGPLPGEHGFRFFPGFYQHIPDTMRRIPYPGNPDGVFGNLCSCPDFEFARTTGPSIIVPTHPPTSFDDLKLDLSALGAVDWPVAAHELAYFASRLFILLSSCEERRYQEWEYTRWWDFVGAETRSDGYRKYLAQGLTRCFVAAKAMEMSTRTGGYIGLQLGLDATGRRGNIDRILNGPTNERWIEPWLSHLTALGVDYRWEHRVTGIHAEGNRITGIDVSSKVFSETVTADWYVAAIPVERMIALATPTMCEAEPILAGLGNLKTNWMNGVQFYLGRDAPIARGHTVYIDSPWALTSISQAQFWRDIDWSKLGNGDVTGILSVDVSDWDTAGINGKAASGCTSEEIVAEVWAQLKAHLDEFGEHPLDDDDRIDSYIDHDIRWPMGGAIVNVEPLLVNTAGSWQHRPPAAGKIENLVLASDYVQTFTDLACMEGANEAARRAVNAILAASGSTAAPCEIFPLHEPAVFAPLRALDRARFKLGLAHHAMKGPGEAPADH